MRQKHFSHLQYMEENVDVAIIPIVQFYFNDFLRFIFFHFCSSVTFAQLAMLIQYFLRSKKVYTLWNHPFVYQFIILKGPIEIRVFKAGVNERENNRLVL